VANGSRRDNHGIDQGITNYCGKGKDDDDDGRGEVDLEKVEIAVTDPSRRKQSEEFHHRVIDSSTTPTIVHDSD
jgi:hypothetical protein